MIGGEDSAVQIVGGLDPLDLICSVAIGQNGFHVDTDGLRLPPLLRRVGAIERGDERLRFATHCQVRINAGQSPFAARRDRW